jgi:hypothetical protein
MTTVCDPDGLLVLLIPAQLPRVRSKLAARARSAIMNAATVPARCAETAEKLAPEARLGGLRPLLAGYASVKAMAATTRVCLGEAMSGSRRRWR